MPTSRFGASPHGFGVRGVHRRDSPQVSTDTRRHLLRRKDPAGTTSDGAFAYGLSCTDGGQLHLRERRVAGRSS